MFRLNRLTLKGFKSIREMDLELGALNVLIGPNGAGKSNLLSFFRMLPAILGGRLQVFVRREGGANAILHHGRKRTPEMKAVVEYGAELGRATYTVVLAGAAPDELMFAEESFFRVLADGAETKLDLGGGHSESKLRAAINEASTQLQPAPLGAASWRFAYYHFHDTSAAAPIKQTSALKDNRRLADDGGNLPAFLYMLRTAHPAHYDQIRDTIRMAAPFFDDFILEPDALNPASIQLEWRERGSESPFFAHQLSDGTLRFMALTTSRMRGSVDMLVARDT